MTVESPVPVFKLYGEIESWSRPDLLHCETIESRSRLHAWSIATHRHADLAQLLYVRSGRALLQVEDWQGELLGPFLLVLPPFCIHSFAFEPGIDGEVITLALPLLKLLRQRCGNGGQGLFQHAERLLPQGTEASWLQQLIDRLVQEYGSRALGREVALQGLLDNLAVWLLRQRLRECPATTIPRGELHLEQFLALVEAHFREHWSVAHYAGELGITAVHLNALCQRLVGSNTLAIVHQRLLLEARRLLRYSTSSVAEIADALGFVDAAYFARFFRRVAGCSPAEYRRSTI
ncbi:AraC family transcriptional regulator [Pseudomonas oryzihabitans]|nr:AraC family transcriptional regulator [Pseudomonas psychrotolerans]